MREKFIDCENRQSRLRCIVGKTVYCCTLILCFFPLPMPAQRIADAKRLKSVPTQEREDIEGAQTRAGNRQNAVTFARHKPRSKSRSPTANPRRAP